MTKLEEIKTRVQASMCITYGSQHPNGRIEARISGDDWQEVLSMLTGAPLPVVKSVERILDECSAWIARPSPEVAERIALAATIAAFAVLGSDETIQ